MITSLAQAYSIPYECFDTLTDTDIRQEYADFCGMPITSLFFTSAQADECMEEGDDDGWAALLRDDPAGPEAPAAPKPQRPLLLTIRADSVLR
jgi:hypothetical protein